MIGPKTLIKRFDEIGKGSAKKGYHGDAAESWFRGTMIKLVMELKEEMKGFKKELKYMRQSLDELELEAAEVKE